MNYASTIPTDPRLDRLWIGHEVGATLRGAVDDEPLRPALVERWIGPDELVTVAEIG